MTDYTACGIREGHSTEIVLSQTNHFKFSSILGRLKTAIRSIYIKHNLHFAIFYKRGHIVKVNH